MPRALLNVPHRDCELAAKIMFESIGWDVVSPGSLLAAKLRRVCRTVKPATWLSRRVDSMDGVDLVVTVKHFDVAAIEELGAPVLWMGINGGLPGAGKNVSWKVLPSIPPAPLLTSNKFYAGNPSNYVCWIPMADADAYAQQPRRAAPHDSPVCFVHNVGGWGTYGWLVPHVRPLVRLYGNGSPDGALSSDKVKKSLRGALCTVHVKGHDCPGFSLYQSILARCPVVLLGKFMDLTGYYDLYEHGRTCLIIEDEWPNNVKSDERGRALRSRIEAAMNKLRDPLFNMRISTEAYARLRHLMWNPERDREEFEVWISRVVG